MIDIPTSILVVSHSYANDENLKNMQRLAEMATVNVIVPDFINDQIFGKVDTGSTSNIRIAYGRISLPKNQYLLKKFDLGMAAIKPNIVHVEYDPWTPIFWQTLIAHKRYAPHARLFCTVKKNTYRALPQPLGWAKNKVAKILARQVTHFFAVNEGVERIYRERILESDASISLLQHLGVDCDRFAPIPRTPNQDLVIGYCGRIDAAKGVPELIAAVEQLRAEGQPISLKMLGAGDLVAALRARNLTWLTLIDPVPHGEVADFLNGLDLFVIAARVLPDHEEHDGHAIMEAMACGLPIIGSTSGVIPELLGTDRGVVVVAGGTGELRDALRACVADPDARARYGSAARQFSLAHFSIDSIARQKLAAYQEALRDV